mgnify:CR=1 FL=1
MFILVCEKGDYESSITTNIVASKSRESIKTYMQFHLPMEQLVKRQIRQDIWDDDGIDFDNDWYDWRLYKIDEVTEI